MIHQQHDNLLEFDNKCKDPIQCHNLEKMYHVKDGIIPSDSRMNEVIDIIDPEDIVKPFPKQFSIAQRQGALKLFKFSCGKLKDYYQMPIDGTGLFHSEKCGCDDCCVSNEGKPNEAHYHNLMGGCIVHPAQKTVIPFAPEAIIEFARWDRAG